MGTSGRKLLILNRIANGRDRDRTDDLYRVKVVPALYPHGSSLSWPTKPNQTSPHLGAIGQKLGSRATGSEGPVRPYVPPVLEHRLGPNIVFRRHLNRRFCICPAGTLEVCLDRSAAARLFSPTEAFTNWTGHTRSAENLPRDAPTT